MIRHLLISSFVAVGLLVVFGGADCSGKKASPTTHPLVSEAKAFGLFGPDAQVKQPDAVPEQQYLLQLMIYRITLPEGAVSRSDEFWKRVDEHAVDVGTYELLFKNGVRVGVAAAEEWGYFKELLGQHPAMTKEETYSGRGGADIELEMHKGVPMQHVFYYDSAGELVGRTYERCDNLIRVSYQPAPRKHGFVRLGMVPVVRSLRESLVAIGPLNQRTVTWFRPEFLYELNLVADVGIDSFLVIAPSSEAKWASRLGNVFLTADGVTERKETLILVRPMMYRRKGE